MNLFLSSDSQYYHSVHTGEMFMPFAYVIAKTTQQSLMDWMLLAEFAIKLIKMIDSLQLLYLLTVSADLHVQ
jgi:hypothetical protein